MTTKSYYLNKNLVINEKIEAYVEVYNKKNTIEIKNHEIDESICMSREFFIKLIDAITEGPNRELKKEFKDILNLIYGGFDPTLYSNARALEIDTNEAVERVCKQHAEIGEALNLFGNYLDSVSDNIDQIRKYYKINSED